MNDDMICFDSLSFYLQVGTVVRREKPKMISGDGKQWMVFAAGTMCIDFSRGIVHVLARSVRDNSLNLSIHDPQHGNMLPFTYAEEFNAQIIPGALKTIRCPMLALERDLNYIVSLDIAKQLRVLADRELVYQVNNLLDSFTSREPASSSSSGETTGKVQKQTP